MTNLNTQYPLKKRSEMRNIRRLHYIVPVLLYVIIASTLFSQDELYIPLEMGNAYQNKTRSMVGAPGDKYWQNHAHYKIKVSVDPIKHRITGKEEIIYYNNSPDSLRRIVVRLYQDRYKKGSVRDSQLDPADIHDGVDLSNIRINNLDYSLTAEDVRILRYGTIMTIELHEPLAPNRSLTMEIAWENLIPEKTRRKRMGAEGDSTMFVAYWYPEISVYDDIDGWDMHSHTGSQEFYHEFGDYEVEISAPGNYLVWATGLLQNADEILPDKILNRYQESFSSDDIIHVVSANDYLEGPVTIQREQNTWIFKASNVPDFAFALSRNHLWDATSLVVDKENARRMMIEGVYKRESKELYEVTDIAKKTIEYLSFELPGVPFPYPQFTVYNSKLGGGMEFPMMANDGTTRTKARTIGLTSHEISHTYFPFYTGTNETKYAWMDEGMVVMLDLEFQSRMSEGYDRLSREVSQYEKTAGREIDLALMTPSSMFSGKSLRSASYGRPAIAYVILQDIMGKDNFKEAIQTFIKQWNGKHPSPYDFFFTFNEVHGEKLTWFWKPWFFKQGYPDLSIKSVISKGKYTNVIIENLGTLPLPISLKIISKENKEIIIKETAAAWKMGNKTFTLRFEHNGDIDRLVLGNNHIPDRNKDNNTYQIN